MNTKRRIHKDKESQITSDDIDNCPNLDKLIELKTTIEGNLVTVKGQLDLAAGKLAKSGEYSDPEWWVKANGYKRILGYLHQRCLMKQRFFNAQNKEVKDAQDLQTAFMDCAKEHLPTDQFYLILSYAHKKLAEGVNN
jgi:hypothetical protein